MYGSQLLSACLLTACHDEVCEVGCQHYEVGRSFVSSSGSVMRSSSRRREASEVEVVVEVEAKNRDTGRRVTKEAIVGCQVGMAFSSSDQACGVLDEVTLGSSAMGPRVARGARPLAMPGAAGC